MYILYYFLICLHINSYIYLFIHLFMYLFIYLSIHSFIYLFSVPMLQVDPS